MTTITAAMVKELRERTDAGMMDCKKALTETNGDMEEAIVYLQKKGIAKAGNKGSRVAAEGIAAIARSADLSAATLIEVNCETDFVARNEAFVAFVQEVAEHAHAHNLTDIDALKASTHNGMTVEEWTKERIAKIGENIQLRRISRFDAGSEGIVGGYIHAGNQIAVIIHVATAGKSAHEADDFAKNVAMHIAASNPAFLDVSAVDDATVEREREIQTAKALESGKTADIVAKMVEGRLSKWKREITLMDQPYVKDPDLTVEKYQKAFGGVSVKGFTRFQVGEGIEKQQTNLADEVAAQLKG